MGERRKRQQKFGGTFINTKIENMYENYVYL